MKAAELEGAQSFLELFDRAESFGPDFIPSPLKSEDFDRVLASATEWDSLRDSIR
jgi:hypothetical protein